MWEGSGIISFDIKKMIVEPVHFGAFLLAKNGIKNCTPAIPAISLAQLFACFRCSHANALFLFLTPPINKQIPIAMFGKFQVVEFSVFIDPDPL